MTIEELRNHEEYAICFKKIKAYPKGFKFTLHYAQIPQAKANALRIIMRDAVKQGYIECIATDLSLDLVETAETFRRL